MSSSSNDNIVKDSAERRQRFRIDDTAILEILSVSEQDVEQRQADSFFSRSAAFVLTRELQEIDRENQALLRSIGDRYSDIAACLNTINNKIDVIGAAVAENSLPEDQKLQSIDLSEGGIGFKHPEKMLEGKFYAMKIWFHKALVGVAVYIRVVACNRAIDGGQHISASFYNMPETECKTITGHIMKVQAALQRSKKEQTAANE